MTSPEAFFAYARERQSIHLRRQAGAPRSEWTADPVLSTYRFCNVFREDDRTTIWFRENVRERVAPEHQILATVLFRWFNRIRTGEAMFRQEALGLGGELPGETAWDALVRTGDVDPLRAAIRQYCGSGPYVTGSYIIKTPDGMDKLDGVLDCVGKFLSREFFHFEGCSRQQEVNRYLLDHPGEVSLQDLWLWLREYPYLGGFMAYEVVTDLRHTVLLDKAPDIMTWANPGPGAVRGLNRIHGRELTARTPGPQLQREMQELLQLSQLPENWPADWQVWEMRDVEHTLCETDKYLRALSGEGRPRQVLR